MINDLDKDTKLRTQLFEALKSEQLYTVFQKVLDARDDSILFVEALGRWKDTVLGLISP